MNGKHTPGPWVVGQSGGVIDRRGCAVAKVQDMPGQDSGERAANAALIAAAPDMLEALRELLAERYALEEPEQFDAAGNWTSDSPASEKARAAIRKATGEQ